MHGPTPPSPSRDRRRDRGVGTVELVLLMPVVMLLTAGVIQFALYLFARQVAISAAQTGARVARTQAEPNPGGWRAAAEAAATERVNQLGPALLNDLSITAVSPSGAVGVRVAATVPNIWPDFLVPDITTVVAGPPEQFQPDR
jgi:Flp pilus assembly protein TadG